MKKTKPEVVEQDGGPEIMPVEAEPKEEPKKEEPKVKSVVVDFIDNYGVPSKREFSKKEHGKDFEKFAEQFKDKCEAKRAEVRKNAEAGV